MWSEPEIAETNEIGDETEMVLNIGPQHPSTHGVLRVITRISGENIREATCDVGYLHRGVEKLIENRLYYQGMTFTDRTDYTSAPAGNLGYILAVEKLLGIEEEIPDRTQFLRMIVMELARLYGHLVWIGTHALDIGAMSMFLYAFREREKISALFEEGCGARLTTSYMRVGGTGRHDDPPGWLDRVTEFTDNFTMSDFDTLLTNNEIFRVRTIGVGIISAENAISYGLTGACLRGSGVPWDLRKARPYCRYDEVDFEIPVGENGDVYSRFMVRLNEMYQAIGIIRQASERAKELRGEPTDITNAQVVMPEIERVSGWEPTGQTGDMEAMIAHFKLVIEGYSPPVGDAYMGIESPKGELGFYFVSDGSGTPYRCHIRSPSFVNLSSLEEMVEGALLADLVACIGSIDIVLGEVDR